MTQTSLSQTPPPRTPPQARRRFRPLVWTVCVVVLLGAAFLGLRHIQESFLQDVVVEASVPPRIGTTSTTTSVATAAAQLTAAQNFILPVIGESATSVELVQLRGKPVVLLFFASWNSASMDAVRALALSYTRLTNAGAAVYAVDNLESIDAARDLVRRAALSMPVLVDTEGTAGEAYRITTLPAFFFVDVHGMLKERVIGGLDQDAILAKALQP